MLCPNGTVKPFLVSLVEPVAYLKSELLRKMVRPGGFELPTFWFVANGVKMLNALFGVACGLESRFFTQLAAPKLAPKTKPYRHFIGSIRKAEFISAERILNHRPPSRNYGNMNTNRRNNNSPGTASRDYSRMTGCNFIR